MKYQSIIFILITTFSSSLLGQSRSSDQLSEDINYDSNDKMTIVTGYFDNSMPFQLSYGMSDQECKGILVFSNLEPIQLEGDCTDSTLALYEFDEHARVSGIITGTKTAGKYDLNWSNYNHTLSYQLTGREDQQHTDQVKVYHSKQEAINDQLLLWIDNRAVTLSHKDDELLRWCSYHCPSPPYACIYADNNGDTEDMSISDRVVSIGSKLYEYKESVFLKNKNGHSYDHFYNYRYPYLGVDKFDNYIEEVVGQQLINFQRSLPTLESDEEWDQDDRLRHRAAGDFFISLVTDDIVSGYLTFYSTTEARTKTSTFTFDRGKKRFYKIREIWRKDFNFSYFLKSLLENQKRRLVAKELPVIRKLLKDTPFSHYNLAAQGIVFFTDYNFVYGRRHILIPYEEISGFIDNKSLSNFIKDR